MKTLLHKHLGLRSLLFLAILLSTFSLFGQLSVTVNADDLPCANLPIGVAEANASGGTEPYTYLWSNDSTSRTITQLVSGTYSVTVTDANGDTATGSATIGQPEPLQVAISEPRECEGPFTIAVNVNGGTEPYSYSWSTGSSDQTITVPAGNYCITVIDNNLCGFVTCRNVQPNPPAVTVTTVDITCNGDNDGSITAVGANGTPPYTFLWSNGTTGPIVSNLIPGDYTVTLTDNRGCTGIATGTVVEPDPITGNIFGDSTVCPGERDAFLRIFPEGGTGNYTYVWSFNAQTGQGIGPMGPGDYSITVTDENGCTLIDEYTIRESEQIVIAGEVSDVVCNGDTTGSVSLTVSGGVQPLSVEWSDGTITNDLDDVVAGSYSVTVTDAEGCEATETFTVGQSDALILSAEVMDVSCADDDDGSIDLTVSGGNGVYRYRWSDAFLTQDRNSLTAGDYSVTVTDIEGCQAVGTYTVNGPSDIVATVEDQALPCNGDLGQLTVVVTGGNPDYTYLWDAAANGQTMPTATDLPAGNYTITVTDASGCSISASGTITEPELLVIEATATDLTCFGDSDGSIMLAVLGGTEPYVITDGDGIIVPLQIDGLPTGNYSYTVTDGNGCTATVAADVNSRPELLISVNDQPLSCAGDFSEEIAVVVTGRSATEVTYAWSTGATTPTVTGLSTGQYSVTVTDDNGCMATASFTVSSPDPLVGSVSTTNVTCSGAGDGAATLTASGGTSPYTFTLDGTQTSPDLINLAAGDYTVILTDANDCSIEIPFTIDEPEVLACEVVVLQESTLGDNGSLTVNVTGGTEDYTYLWSNGATTPTISNLIPGTYTTTVTDANGCMTTCSNTLVAFAGLGDFVWLDLNGDGRQDAGEPGISAYTVFLKDESGTVIDQTTTDADGMYAFTGLVPGNYSVLFPDIPGRDRTLFNQGADAGDNDADPAMNGMTGVYNLDPGEFDPTVDAGFVIIPAKLGDFVWRDLNGDGIQDAGEPGIEGVKVTVTSQDGTYMDMQNTDANGMYMFMVAPGTYKITFGEVPDLMITQANAGTDDTADSDVNPTTMMSGFYTVGPGEMDLTIDAGYVSPCIENISDPGTIGSDQTLCGPGNTPDPILELTPAVGGVGAIQYLWMMTTANPDLSIDFWTPIPNSNSPNYAPGVIYENTYFIRCTRRSACNYVETNRILISIGDDANAQVQGPTTICVDETATWTAINPSPGTQLVWSFSGPSAQPSISGSSATNSWSESGTYNAILTATGRNCVGRDPFLVNVVDNPARCGGNLIARGITNDFAAREVTIEWTVPQDGTNYRFELERSTNGADFETVASDLTEPTYIEDNVAVFRQSNTSPINGRTFYRVRLVDVRFGDLLSNVLEMNLATDGSTMGRIFPNPAIRGNIHVEITERVAENETVVLRIFDAQGKEVAFEEVLPLGTVSVDMNIRDRPAGVYILKMTVGDRTETHRVIVE